MSIEDPDSNSRDEQERLYAEAYARYLEEQMERQYWDEMEKRYEEGLAQEAAEEKSRPLDPSEYNTVNDHVDTTNPNPNLLHVPLDNMVYDPSNPHHHKINTGFGPHDLLHLRIGENDADAATVGEYLGLLLSTLWLQADQFSGKRPFGNSDWQYPVYIAMIKAGIVEGELDEYGYVDDIDDIAADEMILQAIRLAYDHG